MLQQAALFIVSWLATIKSQRRTHITSIRDTVDCVMGTERPAHKQQPRLARDLPLTSSSRSQDDLQWTNNQPLVIAAE